MENNKSENIGRFDQVLIKTTRNVSYLSAPKNTTLSPNGIWSVSAVVDNELLCIKNNIIIRIPVQDVFKVASFNSKIEILGKLVHVKKSSRKSGGESGGESSTSSV